MPNPPLSSASASSLPRIAPLRGWLPSLALIAALLAGCGGSDDSSLDATIADGNAAQIRKEYADLGAKSASTPNLSGTPATAVAATGAATTATSATTGVSAAAPSTDPPIHSFALDALAAVNQARAQPRRCGDTDYPAVAPLSWDVRVAYAALLESEWMLNSNSFGHAWPSGELVWDRLRMAGYDWLVADENIAAGFRSLADAMQAWIDSPPHCVALMRADVRQVGVSVVPGQPGSKYLSYWTMALGTPRTR